MTFVRDRRAARRARELLASALGAMLLLLALGLPVLGAGKPIGPTQLVDPSVAPSATDSATPITFTVTYRNYHGLPPEYVRVSVAGKVLAMAGAGTDWKAGVVFAVAATLPAGTHAVRFEARDEERFVDTLEAGTVAVDQAPPPPTPAPDPDPTPTPRSPAPTAPPATGGSGGSPGGGAGGTGGTSGTGGTGTDGSPTGGSGTDPGRSTDDRELIVQSRAGAPSSFGGGLGDAGSGPTWRPDLPWFVTPWNPAATSGSFGGSDGSGVPDGLGGSWLATLDAGLTTLVLARPESVPALPALVGPTILVTTWMAFMLFSRRRRDGEPPAPDDVLHAAAGTGMGLAAVTVPVTPIDPESLMPRWRRPSLLEARKTDPIRSPGPERPRLTFASAPDDLNAEGAAAAGSASAAAAANGSAERRTIRYAVIPLLDRPDEIMATRIGELVAGDEVQVEQRSGAYCHVLCPDGRRGWVHRTTLGDVVAAAPPPYARTVGSDVDPDAENALAALLAARGLR